MFMNFLLKKCLMDFVAKKVYNVDELKKGVHWLWIWSEWPQVMSKSGLVFYEEKWKYITGNDGLGDVFQAGRQTSPCTINDRTHMNVLIPTGF